MYSKTCVKQLLSKRPKLVFKTNYRLMQVKSIAECSKGQGEHSAILLTFIKLPFVIKIFVLSFLGWHFYAGFTVPFSALFNSKPSSHEHFVGSICLLIFLDPDQTVPKGAV